jgi:hypothetical protein
VAPAFVLIEHTWVNVDKICEVVALEDGRTTLILDSPLFITTNATIGEVMDRIREATP